MRDLIDIVSEHDTLNKRGEPFISKETIEKIINENVKSFDPYVGLEEGSVRDAASEIFQLIEKLLSSF